MSVEDGLGCRKHAWPERLDCPLCEHSFSPAGQGLMSQVCGLCGKERDNTVHFGAPPTVPFMLDDQTTRDLSRAAANVRTWTEKRNEAIRAAREAGGGVREIARATGLNVATVHNIIQPRNRGATREDPGT